MIEEIENYLRSLGYEADIFEANESEKTGSVFYKYTLNGAEYSVAITNDYLQQIKDELRVFAVGQLFISQIQNGRANT